MCMHLLLESNEEETSVVMDSNQCTVKRLLHWVTKKLLLNSVAKGCTSSPSYSRLRFQTKAGDPVRCMPKQRVGACPIRASYY
jgi:hypothetical protein